MQRAAVLPRDPSTRLVRTRRSRAAPGDGRAKQLDDLLTLRNRLPHVQLQGPPRRTSGVADGKGPQVSTKGQERSTAGDRVDFRSVKSDFAAAKAPLALIDKRHRNSRTWPLALSRTAMSLRLHTERQPQPNRTGPNHLRPAPVLLTHHGYLSRQPAAPTGGRPSRVRVRDGAVASPRPLRGVKIPDKPAGTEL